MVVLGGGGVDVCMAHVNLPDSAELNHPHGFCLESWETPLLY